jgi:hypothetical protein
MKSVSLALLAAFAFAAPALADRTMTRAESTPQTRDLVGRPYWSLLARCAGVYGAKTNQLEANPALAASAQDARRTGVEYLELAVAQLEADRNLDRRTALVQITPTVRAGREEGTRILAMRGAGMTTAWALAETLCADTRAGYRGH